MRKRAERLLRSEIALRGKRKKPTPPPAAAPPPKRIRREGVKEKKKPDVINDFALTVPSLVGAKFTLGDRYSLQIEEVTVKGGKGTGKSTFKYEAIVITREGIESEDEDKTIKPFKFNIPSKLLIPLKNVLCHIAENLQT